MLALEVQYIGPSRLGKDEPVDLKLHGLFSSLKQPARGLQLVWGKSVGLGNDSLPIWCDS